MRAFPWTELQITSWETLNIRTAQPQFQASILYNPMLSSLGWQMGEDVKEHHFCDVCV